MHPKLCLGIVFAAASISLATVAAVSLRTAKVITPESVTGQKFHDFGKHTIDDPIELTHVFTLKNETSQVLHIRKVSSTCGCTKARESTNAVAPGDEFEISVALKLSHAGTRREQVQIVCDETEPIVLELRGSARTTEGFYCMQRSVALDAETPARVLAVQLRPDDTEPVSIKIEAPDGLQVHTEGWKMVMAADPSSQRPSRWHFWIELSSTNPASLSADRILITDALGRSARVGLRGLPAEQ